MSKTIDAKTVKLQRALWFYTFVAAVGFVAPFAWNRYAEQLVPSLARAAAGWGRCGVMLAWGLAICAAVIGLGYGACLFIRRPLHLGTILPILGCVGILVSARQWLH
jgi:hypothetical protein